MNVPLPRALAGNVLVTFCGSLTPEQLARAMRRYDLNITDADDFLNWLVAHNSIYQSWRAANPDNAHLANPTQGVFIDRTSTSSDPLSEENLQEINFSSTAYSSTNSQDSVDFDIVTTTSHLAMDNNTQQHDFILRRSSQYATSENFWQRSFPSLFPFGCGGLHSPRVRSLTLKKFILRLERLHDGRFLNILLLLCWQQAKYH